MITMLIDTGATKTFINENLLNRFKNLEIINKKSSSFLLADGIAQFPIVGQVKLSIRFANVNTYIEANVARNLCTSMILGMDYINRYNLSINIKRQQISIEYRNRLLTMSINPNKNHTVVSDKPTSSPFDDTRVTSAIYTIVLTTDTVEQNTHNSLSNPILPTISLPNDTIQTLNKSISNVTHRTALFSLLNRFSQVFDTSKHNIANTSIHHVINTVPHSPSAYKPYHQPDKEKAMHDLIQEFLAAGLISESHSPYAAPSFLVAKKDGSSRFVVDYRRLNLITIKDSSPLPNMEDTLRKLGQGYNFFTKLDLRSGFYQIPIRDMDKQKTAFVTSFGL